MSLIFSESLPSPKNLLKGEMHDEILPYSGSSRELNYVGIYLGDRCDNPLYRNAKFPKGVELIETEHSRGLAANHSTDNEYLEFGKALDIIKNGNVMATCFYDVDTGNEKAAWIEINTKNILNAATNKYTVRLEPDRADSCWSGVDRKQQALAKQLEKQKKSFWS